MNGWGIRSSGVTRTVRDAVLLGHRLRRACTAAGLVIGAWGCGDREPTAPAGGRVRERWHRSQTGYAWARPAVAGGLAYFGTGNGFVIARDTATGARRWAAHVAVTQESVDGANILVRDGVVAVAVWYHTVGLDAATGRELWRYAAPPDIGLNAGGYAGHVRRSHLDADDQTLYIPAWGASVSAVDLRTGVVRWVWQPGRAATDTAASGHLFRSGAEGVRVDGDLVFATVWHNVIPLGGRSESWLVALDRTTGREQWRVVLPVAGQAVSVSGAPAVAGNLVMVNAGMRGEVFAVDRTTRRIAWQHITPDRQLTPGAQPEVYGDVVYVDGGDSHLYALRARDGAVLWRSAFASQATTDLLVTERRVVLPEGSHLNIFDRQTGRLLVRLAQPRVPEGEALFASPATFSGGRLFVTLNGAAWSVDEP